MSSSSGKSKGRKSVESLKDLLKQTLRSPIISSPPPSVATRPNVTSPLRPRTLGEMAPDANATSTSSADYVRRTENSRRKSVSPIRTRTAPAPATTTTTSTSSSSSSSGSVSGRVYSAPNPNIPSKSSNSNPKPQSGEQSVGSSPQNTMAVGHRRSDSTGSQSASQSIARSASSQPVQLLPAGNICPSGKVKSALMRYPTRPEHMRRGSTANYGVGNIMPELGTKPELESHYYPKNMLSYDADEFKNKGNRHYMRGRFLDALGCFDKAIELAPNNASYRFNKAAALIGLNRLAEATKECEEAIRLDSKYVKAHLRLGSLLVRLGQVEKARYHLHFDGGERQLDFAPPRELQKLELVEQHMSQCAEARKLGDWRCTLREVDAAINCGADASPHLISCRAEALLKLNQSEDAYAAMSEIPNSISAYSLSIFGMPSQAYIYYVRAQFELASGKFDAAIIEIEKAEKLDPHNMEIITLLKKIRLVAKARARGNDLYKAERYTEASVAYGDGIKYDPTNSILYSNRAACWFMIGQWEKSVEDCNNALIFHPKYVKALLRRAASNCKLKRWGEAVKDYEVLTKERPNDKDVAESLFYAHVALKDSRKENISDMSFGGEVELISGLEQFRAAIASSGASVVHFLVSNDARWKEKTSCLDTLCTRFPSVNFYKVELEEDPAIAHAESIRVAPTIRIYKCGRMVKEMLNPSQKVVETSVRHYSSVSGSV